jgi:hypothetical protein
MNYVVKDYESIVSTTNTHRIELKSAVLFFDFLSHYSLFFGFVCKAVQVKYS